MCSGGRKTPAVADWRRSRGTVAALTERKKKKKANDFKTTTTKNVTSVRNFSGIFLTMHLASCYSFKHTLNSCFVLCCKRFFYGEKKDAICLYKNMGHVNRDSFTFCLLKEIWLALMYCTVCENDTKHVYTTNKYWDIFFFTGRPLFICTWKHQNTRRKKNPQALHVSNSLDFHVLTRLNFSDDINKCGRISYVFSAWV